MQLHSSDMLKMIQEDILFKDTVVSTASDNHPLCSEYQQAMATPCLFCPQLLSYLQGQPGSG